MNPISGRSDDLVRVSEVTCDSANQQRIAAICNEADVYQWLFRDALEGRPYEEANAYAWLQWA